MALKENEKNIVIAIDRRLHQLIKTMAFQQGSTLKDWVVKALAEAFEKERENMHEKMEKERQELKKEQEKKQREMEEYPA